MPDRYAVCCNYAVGTNVAREGAQAWLSPFTRGDPSHVRLIVRSRSGRWVCKWERLTRLKNFRAKTIVDGCAPGAHGDQPTMFETKESAQEEAAWWAKAHEWWLAERLRPREFHDPGDEDRNL